MAKSVKGPNTGKVRVSFPKSNTKDPFAIAMRKFLKVRDKVVKKITYGGK